MHECSLFFFSFLKQLNNLSVDLNPGNRWKYRVNVGDTTGNRWKYRVNVGDTTLIQCINQNQEQQN